MVLAILALSLNTVHGVAAADVGLAAIIDGPPVVWPGEKVMFDGSGSVGNIANYSWDFHDGGKAFGAVVGHAFVVEGRYTVSLAVTGLNGHQALGTLPVDVVEATPSVRIQGPGTVAEGQSVTYMAVLPMDSVEGLEFSWDFGDGTLASGDVVHHRFDVAGGYRVHLVAADRLGGMGYDDLHVTVVNAPPRASFSGPSDLAEDEEAVFNAGASTDVGLDGEDLRYSWDMGDGSRAMGEKVIHAFPRPGNYTVTLTVMDDQGVSNTTSRAVRVHNFMPEVRVSGPRIMEEGSVALLGAVATDTASDLASMNYAWTLGTSGRTTAMTVWDDGGVVVGLGVRDDEGATASASTVLSVANRPPAVSIVDVSAAATVALSVAGSEGTPAYLRIVRSGSIELQGSLLRIRGNPGARSLALGPVTMGLDDRWYAVVSFGADALSPNVAVAPTWLNVTFGDGGTESLKHALVRALPSSWFWTVDLNRLVVGHRLRAVAAVFDPGSDDVAVTWHLPDGTSVHHLLPSHVGRPTASTEKVDFNLVLPRVTSDRTYPLSVGARDDDGGEASASATIYLHQGVLTTGNLAPSLGEIPRPNGVLEGIGVNFTATGVDAVADLPTLRFSWSFGDGEIAPDLAVRHTFHHPGVYPVAVTVSDGVLATTSGVVVTVADTAPTLDALGPFVLREDEPLVLRPPMGGSPADLDDMTLVWDLGDGTVATSVEVRHNYTRAGPYEGSLRIQDDEGRWAFQPFQIVVSNRGPVAIAPDDSNVKAGHTLFVRARAYDDPSDAAVLNYTWTIGNQTAYGRRLAWEAEGTTVPWTLTATDDQGASDTIQGTFDVTPDVPTLNLRGMTLSGDGLVRPLTLTIDRAPPPEGDLRWTFSDDGSVAPDPSMHRFQRDGSFLISVDLFAGRTPLAHASAPLEVKLDSDGDGLGDHEEAVLGGDPYSGDTDGDGRLDGTEASASRPTRLDQEDTDGDGLWDGYNITSLGKVGELSLGTDPLNPDTDRDGIPDGEEVQGWTIETTRNGTPIQVGVHPNPLLNDTDGDGLGDRTELLLGLDPTQADTDEDGLDDGEETTPGNDAVTTDATSHDTDHDGVWDYYDRLPEQAASLPWKTLHPPGLVRFSQNYSVYSLRGLVAWRFTYDYFSGECKFLSDNTASATKSSVVTEDAVKAEIMRTLHNGGEDNYTVLSTHRQGLTDERVIPYTAGKCTGDAPRQYRIDYALRDESYGVDLMNTKPVEIRDDAGAIYPYALISLPADSGRDMSLVLQFSIPEAQDRTSRSDDAHFTVPAMVYSLYSTVDYEHAPSFYKSLAFGAYLNPHAYQFELKIPGDQLNTSTLVHTDTVDSLLVYLMPVWVSSNGGSVVRRAMLPTTFQVASISLEQPRLIYQLIARLAVNISAVEVALPNSIQSYPTGYYTFGCFSVYVFHGNEAEFSTASLTSVDAIVLISSSESRLVSLRESISWGEKGVWFENYSDAFNTAVKAYKFSLLTVKIVDKTNSADHLYSIREAQPGEKIYLQSDDDSIYVQKVRAGENERYYVGKGHFVLRTTMDIETLERRGTLEWKSQQYELVADPDESILLKGRFGLMNKGLRAASIGAVGIVQGRTAVMSFLDGNYIKAVVYGSETSIGVLGILKSEVTLEKLGIRGGAQSLKFGAIAVAAVGTIEAGYELYLAANSESALDRQIHVENSATTSINTVLTLLPMGLAVSAGWTVGTVALSYFVDNVVAREITATPGSTITFFVVYSFSSEVPGAIARDALDKAVSSAVNTAEFQNSIHLIPSIAIVP